VKRIIKNMSVIVLLFTAGTAVSYAYLNYNDCRCAQAVPGVDIPSVCCYNNYQGYGGDGDARCCGAADTAAGKKWVNAQKACVSTAGPCYAYTWYQNSSPSASVNCTSSGAGCYVENSINNTNNMPKCVPTNTGTNWLIPQASSGSCPPGGNSGVCPGMITGYNLSYTCTQVPGNCITLCSSMTCPSGTSRTGKTYSEEAGGCCTKTPCPSSCSGGQFRTANSYQEDGPCCYTCTSTVKFVHNCGVNSVSTLYTMTGTCGAAYSYTPPFMDGCSGSGNLCRDTKTAISGYYPKDNGVVSTISVYYGASYC